MVVLVFRIGRTSITRILISLVLFIKLLEGSIHLLTFWAELGNMTFLLAYETTSFFLQILLGLVGGVCLEMNLGFAELLDSLGALWRRRLLIIGLPTFLTKVVGHLLDLGGIGYAAAESFVADREILGVGQELRVEVWRDVLEEYGLALRERDVGLATQGVYLADELVDIRLLAGLEHHMTKLLSRVSSLVGVVVDCRQGSDHLCDAGKGMVIGAVTSAEQLLG